MDLRGWTLEKFGQRAGISTSLAHQIANEGKDNVRTRTFEGIARAFGMTPAQLRQRIDEDVAQTTLTERRARIARLLPDVPEERLDAIEQHVTLAMQAVPPAKTREAGPANGPRRRRAEILTGVDVMAEHDPKRRQFSIRKVQTWGEHAVADVLAALGLNRDFRPAEASA